MELFHVSLFIQCVCGRRGVQEPSILPSLKLPLYFLSCVSEGFYPLRLGRIEHRLLIGGVPNEGSIYNKKKTLWGSWVLRGEIWIQDNRNGLDTGCGQYGCAFLWGERREGWQNYTVWVIFKEIGETHFWCAVFSWQIWRNSFWLWEKGRWLRKEHEKELEMVYGEWKGE